MNNGVAFITLNGEQIQLRFGLPALKRIGEKMSTADIWTEKGGFTDVGLSHILYAAYINECLRKDIPPVLAFEFFFDYVDERQDMEELQAAINSFSESKNVVDLVDAKKKKTKSDQSDGKK